MLSTNPFAITSEVPVCEGILFHKMFCNQVTFHSKLECIAEDVESFKIKEAFASPNWSTSCGWMFQGSKYFSCWHGHRNTFRSTCELQATIVFKAVLFGMGCFGTIMSYFMSETRDTLLYICAYSEMDVVLAKRRMRYNGSVTPTNQRSAGVITRMLFFISYLNTCNIQP